MVKSIKLDIDARINGINMSFSIVGESAKEVTTEAKEIIKLMSQDN